jgi:LacI family transcriptional regulator
MPVTMKQVAARAGVSIKTVSRVINDQGEISEATRQHVRSIIEELGYRPNRLARGLLTGRTSTVGIIIPDITDPFFPDLILSAERAARARQFNVFLCNANREPELELHYVNALRDSQVDGLMLAGSHLQKEGLSAAIANIPAVILSQYVIPGATVYSMNDFEAAYGVGMYLYSLGHRRLAYIDGGWSGSSQQRRDGFITALEDQGIGSQDIAQITAFPATVETGQRAARDVLAARPDITAIACYNDVLAIGAIQATHAIGRRVPDDLSIVGYDDVPEAARATPPLTTVHYDRHLVGRDMMNRLLDVVEGLGRENERIIVEGYLLERQSCAPLELSAVRNTP